MIVLRGYGRGAYTSIVVARYAGLTQVVERVIGKALWLVKTSTEVFISHVEREVVVEQNVNR